MTVELHFKLHSQLLPVIILYQYQNIDHIQDHVYILPFMIYFLHQHKQPNGQVEQISKGVGNSV